MAGAEKNKEITSKLTETAMLSYMLRLNYSYANKYLLTLTGRPDGYSAFGKNNKYASSLPLPQHGISLPKSLWKARQIIWTC